MFREALFLIRLSVLLGLAGRPHFCFVANRLVELAIGQVVSNGEDDALGLSG